MIRATWLLFALNKYICYDKTNTRDRLIVVSVYIYIIFEVHITLFFFFFCVLAVGLLLLLESLFRYLKLLCTSFSLEVLSLSFSPEYSVGEDREQR